MKVQIGIGACALLIASAPLAVAQPSGAGTVKLASGSVVIMRESTIVPVKVGQVLLETDTLRTGADGRVGVTLKDDTRVSLGPNSEVRLQRFVYAPGEGRLALALEFVRGVAAYVSGRIAKLAPDAIRLETPAAIVGVRGTTVAIRVGP